MPIEPSSQVGRSPLHLRRGGTSLVLDLPADSPPCVLHWGPDLGDAMLEDLGTALEMPYVDSVISAPPKLPVLPLHSAGWLGRAGIRGSRGGRDWSVAFARVVHRVDDAGSPEWPDGPPGAARVVSECFDEPGQLCVTAEIEIHESGLVRVRARIRNDGDAGYEVAGVEPALPVPGEASELVDMTGRHTKERVPQRRPFNQGQWVRESWGGRPGHDSPTFLAAGCSGFGFQRGRVWAVHLAWSGNQVVSAEHSPTSFRLLRGGELLLPGEMILDHGDEYVSPWLVGSWGEGIDALSHRFHDYLRGRPAHPRSTRPVVLNVWEAVYFDQDPARLNHMADLAAAIGVERLVVDDGWFLGRRDDTSSLGDWIVDPSVYPNGLEEVADHVRSLGMQFGLWFEPEMVNLDSDLARAHPDWVMGTSHGPGVASRQQHVLDLGNPDAYAHVLEQVSGIVGTLHVDYIKWDHNRALVDAGSGPEHRPGVHAQVEAVYRMMTELKARHPGLEIESCAGGGARLDLGIMEIADRTWVSDCIDAHERHRMMRWTGVILPPEMLGSHIGSGADHSTGRVHDLDFRAGTAIWGDLGIEWDLTRISDEQRDRVAQWVAFYKSVRPLLHSGRVVRAELPNPALQLDGVVAPDGSEALYRLSALDHTLTWPPGRVTLPGLDPDRTYRVTTVSPAADGPARPGAAPWTREGVTLSGRVLAEVGLQAPEIKADHLVIISVVDAGR
ncbi:alpha-galactosidase [Demequina sp.]|uniref:alpha-galactosidase n=1 Tax=Demequina sp. TaxID=2050685 RepID=UPI0025D37A0A|nr:alpha-galactosidase [Demequina sp.]